jgi:hypothetical protein
VIDPTSEPLVRLADVPRLKWLPGRREGKRIHVATVHRWAQRGLRGVRLETLRAGGALVTSEAAITRFFERLTEPAAGADVRTNSQRAKAVERAERELEQAGI